MPFTEDLSTFFNTDDFAINAHIDDGSVKTAITGILDTEYVEVHGIEANHPVFLTADTTAAQGNTLTTNPDETTSQDYTIQSVQPDGTGTYLLVLEEL